MKLSQLIKEEYLIHNLKSTSKEEALRELASYCNLSTENLTKEEVLDALIEREEEQTTGIGEGIAFPHARFARLNTLHIIIGISKEGIDFDSLDKKPVHYFVMMLVNRSRPNELLKTRAALTKFLISGSVRDDLLKVTSKEEFRKIFHAADIEIDYEITAKDIMRPPVAKIDSGISMHEAARTLHLHHSDSLPVVDDKQLFIGEVSCYDLFSYGLPDFFNNLHVISFVKHMDPFEKYFKVDRDLSVMEFLENKKTDSPIISFDATLMEIIFEMTVKNREILYVLDADKKLIGILDRYGIIDKILMTR
jgi:mannitol/fructose-specific phosphotransferase system IIA component (Ntr-type)